MSDWNKTPYVEDDMLHYGQYWDTGGGSIILREALSPDHPEHLYNYLKRHNITPEDFGVRCPVDEMAAQEYGHLTREELLNLVLEQRREIEAMYRAGF